MPTWEVEVSGPAVKDLENSMNQGLIMEDGRRLLFERMVAQIGNLKVVIYSDEHPPPHFLVSCSEGSCRFQISDCSALDGFGLEKYRRNIRQWHKKNKQLLIDTWNSSRPSGCPVGPYRD